MNTIRRLPALVLVVVLAILPLRAWASTSDDPLVLTDELSALPAIVWSASVAANGRLAIRIEYVMDEADRTLDLRVPAKSEYVRLDGKAVALDNGTYATLSVRGSAVVTYELPGRVTRYEDGALLRMAEVQNGSNLAGDASLFPCPRCSIEPTGYGNAVVDGALFLPGADDVDVLLSQLDPIRSEADSTAFRFTGIDDGVDSVSMLATLPASAVPDVPLSSGSVVDARTAALDDLARADESFRGPSDGGAGPVFTAALLTTMLAAVAAWIGWRLTRARRERLATRDPSPVLVGVEGAFSKPSDLEPALAGLTVGGAGSGDRSPVAGTLLELARRGVIDIDGIDSQRYTLTIPAGARGTTVFEEAVLERLRPQGQVAASATLTGPPLWGTDSRSTAQALSKVLTRQARKARLIRTTLSALVLVPASLAMGVVALVGSDGLSGLGWFAALAGPVLAVVAAMLTGVSLTGRGHDERRRWLVYADWLRNNTQLARVGAPGIATWGELLPHAAALGAAPVAAKALAPSGEG